MIGEPATPVPAATVILVRTAAAPGHEWELFMVRRPVRSEFAADVYVFPGGKIDDEDRDPGLGSLVEAELSSDAPDGMDFRVGAIRELFEEAGVLLATGRTAQRQNGEAITSLRRRLLLSQIGLSEIVRAADLKLAISDLHPFAHWITPGSMPRRYDTWFYIARLPHGQSPGHDAIETVDSLWTTPHAALELARNGQLPLVFVTARLLERMSRFTTIEQLLSSVSPADLQAVTPRIVMQDGAAVFLIPGEPGYWSDDESNHQHPPSH